MERIGVFYGSSTGNTRIVAELIKSNLDSACVDLYDLHENDISLVNDYQNIIFGISSWDVYDLQEDWEAQFQKLKNLDLTGKMVALYGLGDQEAYKDAFANSLFYLYEALQHAQCRIIGQWPADGYRFKRSKALVNNQFVGLVIDEDQQSHLTELRVAKWLDIIMPEFKLTYAKQFSE